MAAAVPASAAPASSLAKIQAGIGPPADWHHTWSVAQGGHWVAAHAHLYDVFFRAGPGRNFAKVSVTWRGGHWGAYIDSAGRWNWPS